MANEFSHIDKKGDPSMVDVGDKQITKREATAQTIVVLPSEVLAIIKNDDIHTKKGPVFQTAILAGIMGAKKTSDLIPLCHPLPINKCGVDISINKNNNVVVLCTVKTEGKTGVEMEALTGASIAALTIYDMCKAFSHDIIIESTKLISKSGGKRDFKRS